MRPGVLLLTGATGFVGRAVVQRLQRSRSAEHAARACEVRLLVRDVRRAEQLGLPPAWLRQAALEDEAALAAAVRGVSAVVHLAGAVKAWRRGDFYRANALGTERLVTLLRRHAAGSRLIHVSSLAAAGPSTDGATSALPPERCRPLSQYGESKRRGELAVVAAGEDLEWVILRPPVVYGESDAATALLVRQATAPVVAVPWRPRPLSLIHVDDVATAIEAAVRSDCRGCVLPLDGPERLDTSEVMRRLAVACGRRARLLRVPLPVARAAALAADGVARLRHRAGFFSVDKVRDLSGAGWVADAAPAHERLGFRAHVGTDEGFARVACALGHGTAADPRAS